MPPISPRERVSVVMATLNGSAFVEEQLESIARQTQPPAELQVGDDGSEDDTVAILERFARRAPFPVTITVNPVRLGAPENFLAICARARGPLLALSDWDDVWRPTKLERAVSWFGDPRVALVVHRSQVVDADLRPLGRSYPAIGRTRVHEARRVDPWMAVPGMAMIFRKALLDAAAPAGMDRPAEATGMPLDHDDWIYHLAGCLGRIVFLAEDLMDYRQHGASYMGAPGAGVLEQSQRGLRLGSEAFRAQAAMFRARRDYWRTLSDRAAADVVRIDARRSAAWCDHLASLQDARAAVRDAKVAVHSRAARIGVMAVQGAYRARTRSGRGRRALGADVAGLALGPSAPIGSEAERTDELAKRVARARSAGRSPATLARELTDEGLAPPYGRRWTDEMIRDLVYRGRRAIEMEALQAGAERAD